MRRVEETSLRAAKTSVEFNIAKRFVHRNIYLNIFSNLDEKPATVGYTLLNRKQKLVITR